MKLMVETIVNWNRRWKCIWQLSTIITLPVFGTNTSCFGKSNSLCGSATNCKHYLKSFISAFQLEVIKFSQNLHTLYWVVKDLFKRNLFFSLSKLSLERSSYLLYIYYKSYKSILFPKLRTNKYNFDIFLS